MSMIDQDGGRVVALHPIFTLRRVVSAQATDDLSVVCRDIQAFVSAHGDENLIARSDVSLLDHMQRGELILVYEGVRARSKLIGVCLCLVSQNLSPAFELAYTAIDRNFRGRGLARLAASAALVGHLINVSTIEGIVLACRPGNVACRRAAEKLGVEFCSASDIYSLVPRLKSHIEFHRHHHHIRHWAEEPLLGLVQPQAVRDGAWNLLGADAPSGLAWSRGGRIFLEGEWHLTPDRDATRNQLREIAEGRTPRVRLWDDPPRVGRCA